MNTNFVFSKNLCAAYIAALVRSFENRNKTGYLGRTALQKLAYFSPELGVPIPCSFEIYTYGPYSDAITFDVDSLLADDVLSDQSRDKKYSNYKLGPAASDFFKVMEPEIHAWLPMIDTVVDVFGGFSPQQLELIATLRFIAQRQRTVAKGAPARESVIDEFRRIKKDKFTVDEINGWYDALKRAKLI
jgi:uncharacterized protein YwgA